MIISRFMVGPLPARLMTEPVSMQAQVDLCRYALQRANGALKPETSAITHDSAFVTTEFLGSKSQNCTSAVLFIACAFLLNNALLLHNSSIPLDCSICFPASSTAISGHLHSLVEGSYETSSYRYLAPREDRHSCSCGCGCDTKFVIARLSLS